MCVLIIINYLCKFTSGSGLSVVVDVRVTPRQVLDPQRPWIGREEGVFCATLRQLGASLERTLYFEKEKANLRNHFRVLDTLAEKPLL